jgi:hypothetical protein
MKRIETRLALLEQRRQPASAGDAPEVAATRERLADRGAWFHAAPPAVQEYFTTIIASCGPWGDESADEVRTIVSARTKETHPLFWPLTDIVEFAYVWRGGIGLEEAQVRLLDSARYRLEGHIVRAECNGFLGPASRERTYARMFGAGYDRAALCAPVGKIPLALLPLWRAGGAHDAETLALMGIFAAELALLATDDAEREERTS